MIAIFFHRQDDIRVYSREYGRVLTQNEPEPPNRLVIAISRQSRTFQNLFIFLKALGHNGLKPRGRSRGEVLSFLP